MPTKKAPEDHVGIRKPLSSLAVHTAHLPSSSINSFCGAMAGVASGIVTCPLDVIKTKLQAQSGFRPYNGTHPPATSKIYSGMIGTARTIWTQDGLRGMYRGLGPMLLGYLPTWAVYMTVYEGSRDFYYSKIDNKWIARVYASVTAGACSTLVTNPIWVIKTRLQAQASRHASDSVRSPWYYRNTLHAAKTMYKKEGILAFYSGLAPALLGLTHVAIQFPLYEFLKTRFTGLEMGENSTDDKTANYVGIAGATFLSKICATSATYPHEVLRTRLQTQQRQVPAQSPDGISHRGSMGDPPFRRLVPTSSDGMVASPRYKGVVNTYRIILREEGWRAFYNGMGVNMIRAVPAAMTTMLTFETLKKFMHQLQHEGQNILEVEGVHH
ncbi:mitochondrial folate transporter-like protein/carrier [Viridothelium virens]|uniref:Mitochondrial folate transporter-like protein/carrier n=1 Tax=Viridothelium virens TaxID=1048519 RepID=A0A6A6HCF3_VIRVR|nr:mitochondrial folate transporter-like protein/carrier [Viridothelium virens]